MTLLVAQTMAAKAAPGSCRPLKELLADTNCRPVVPRTLAVVLPPPCSRTELPMQLGLLRPEYPELPKAERTLPAVVVRVADTTELAVAAMALDDRKMTVDTV